MYFKVKWVIFDLSKIKEKGRSCLLIRNNKTHIILCLTHIIKQTNFRTYLTNLTGKHIAWAMSKVPKFTQFVCKIKNKR